VQSNNSFRLSGNYSVSALLARFNQCGMSVFFLFLLGVIPLAQSEEGGSGRYFPGSMSSFMDGVPAREGVIARLNAIHYSGDYDSRLRVPVAGLVALNADVETNAIAFTGVWRPPFEPGGQWSYAAGLTVPFVDVSVQGDVVSPNDPLGRTVRRKDSVSGLGDVLLFPLMLNYRQSDALSYSFRVGVYAPTGEFETGRLANHGKNFWSVGPTLSAVYYSPDNGRELSAFLGATFNEENDDTDYESGTQMHMEVTAAQHFPLWGGVAGAGLTGFWYEQVTSDSGDGATFGDFKAEARGIGPTVSFISKVGGQDLMAELKWLHEFDVLRRPEGDTVFLKVALKW